MYFEIYKKGKLIKRGNEFLNGLSWSVELMDAPALKLTLPAEYLDYISGREEIKIYANSKVFWGIITDIDVDKKDETIDLNIDHIVKEWEYRQISVNNAVKDKNINVIYKEEDGKKDTEPTIQDTLEDIYNDKNFAYPGWKLNFEDGSGDTNIDYVYSRQNKLEALTQTCELTPDLFWRVDFSGEKRIDIGPFGEKRPYIVSTKPRGEHNIPIVEEPTVDYDFENVINLATVYSEKSDSGMSSMTLREVYERPSEQLRGFPVVILRANVNNERDYRMYSTQYPKLAPNNELEYAVLDEESIAMEAGTVIEGTYAFNDLGSFNTDSKTVTDADRIKAAVTAYHATVRKLKQSRRSYRLEVVTEEIPAGIKVGDKIRFMYDNSIFKLEACSSYWKKILSYDDWFYITKIDYDIGVSGEVDTLTLEKYLKIDRETKNT